MMTVNLNPGQSSELWVMHTPIIPEVGYDTYINNVGDVPIKAVYEWKPPLGSHWKEVNHQEFLPNEDGTFYDNGQSFYHQRVIVKNLSSSVSEKFE